MSRTYDIACHDCRVVLWIGQDSRVYYTVGDLKKQREFFYGHIGHRLEFNDAETLSARYDFKSLDFDEDEDGDFIEKEPTPLENKVKIK